VRLIVDVDMGVPILPEVTTFVDSYHRAVVGTRFRRDDELFTSCPVIASVSLVEIGPSTRTDCHDTVVMVIGEIGKFSPDGSSHSATSRD
jgi:hypothetical protein